MGDAAFRSSDRDDTVRLVIPAVSLSAAETKAVYSLRPGPACSSDNGRTVRKTHDQDKHCFLHPSGSRAPAAEIDDTRSGGDRQRSKGLSLPPVPRLRRVSLHAPQRRNRAGACADVLNPAFARRSVVPWQSWGVPHRWDGCRSSRRDARADGGGGGDRSRSIR